MKISSPSQSHSVRSRRRQATHDPLPDRFESSPGGREISAKEMARVREPIATAKLEEVISDSARGCNSRAAIVRLGGKKFFLKGNAGSPSGSRYANWESDLLTSRLCERLKLRCPKVELIKLEGSEPLRERLGSTVLSMQFVDSDFVSGKIRHGYYQKDKANQEAFLKMFLLDCLIGNADRRGANYFTVEKSAGAEPILIDNNSGFGSSLLWQSPTNHCNFIKSYQGLGSGEVLKDMGTIHGVMMDTHDYPTLLDDPKARQQALSMAQQLPKLLDDKFIDQIVAELPRQVIPRGTEVEPPSSRIREFLSPEHLELLYSGQPAPLSGAALWQARQEELTSTLKWRRDHLAQALQEHFARSY